MSDIKTILRELSVPCQIYILYNNLNKDIDILNPNIFCQICYKIILNTDNLIVQNQLNKITEQSYFNEQLSMIINNGKRLAKSIFLNQEFQFTSKIKVEWKGCYETDGNIDIIINQYPFSLKEESFILKNMGLYQYINLVTDDIKPRGIHIFKEYAPLEFEHWFNTTWNQLLFYLSNHQSWQFINQKNNQSSINQSQDQIIFTYNNTVNKLNRNCSLTEFELQTTSLMREKVFAKWINQYLKNNQEYEIAKRNCAETAGKNLVNFLNTNKSFNQNNLKKLLQISSEPYYFAKATTQNQVIYKVPSSTDFSNLINIKSINYSVPRSQLNIITTIENKNTGNSLTLKNELRYSHGQFNGTPEAKMYYDNQQSTGLEVFYIPIY